MNAVLERSVRTPLGNPGWPGESAILLADLVDSTAFAHGFGEEQAAVALQRLDLQVRDLLEFTGGRLIDKASSVLAVFDRPMQAIDFALRYQQVLREFSVSQGAPVSARIGIHVGQLSTSTSSGHDGEPGAAVLVADGPAKPVVVRLMTLALPGQILVSAAAERLARRAQAELGERTAHIRWALHGRYRFKGAVAPMLVHEVGDRDLAPLRQPESSGKAWREPSLWRRSPALLLETLVLLSVVSFYAYAMLGRAPALGYQQGDWLVLGDANDFTGDQRLKDSLVTALRESLGQSRYLNVVADRRVRDVLQRMGRGPQATVDRSTGSEIAIREGARALLLPSVAEVGGRLRISLEVVDPNSQATLFTESADGRGIQSALAVADAVSKQLRGHLGESEQAVAADAVPLPLQLTASLDALRDFSLVASAKLPPKDADAIASYSRALRRDPGFALARLAIARLQASDGYLQEARVSALAAAGHRSRLSERHALELDALLARLTPGANPLPRYRAWAARYPDDFDAYYGYALRAWANRAYTDALAFLDPALSQHNPAGGDAYFLRGVILLAQKQYPEAGLAFRQAESLRITSEQPVAPGIWATERELGAALRPSRTPITAR